MNNSLNLTWHSGPHGHYASITDAQGNEIRISSCAYPPDSFFFQPSMVLTKQMCLELSAVLAYLGWSGQIPEVHNG